MVNQSNFIVRKSGRRENNYYIDYTGIYKTTGIAGITGLKAENIDKIYSSCGAIFDDEQEIYYFTSVDAAKSAIGEIFANVSADAKGKVVYLSEAEVEYIRRALINEGSNTIHLKSKIKDEIFRKLNG